MPKNQEEIVVTNQDIERTLVELGGGASLRELIESGRLLKADGNPFIPLGEKIQQSTERLDYSDEEMEVFDAVRNGGVFFFNHVNQKDPDYRPVFLKQTTETYMEQSDDGLDLETKTRPTMKISAPLAPEEVANQIVGGDWDEMKDDGPVRLAKPGFFNRMLDSVSRFFGGRGTEAMNTYRQNEEAIRQHNDKFESAKRIADKVNAYRQNQEAVKQLANARRAADKVNALGAEQRTAAAGTRTKADKMKWISKALSPEALGYDINHNNLDIQLYKADADVITSFSDQIRKIAESDSKSRHLLRVMGSYDSHDPTGSSLRKLYSAYRNEVRNGRDLDIAGMIQDAAHKRVTTNAKNLDRVLTGQAPVRSEQKDALQR